MTRIMKRKGQTALEGAFVVLFIIVAVGFLMQLAIIYGSNMQRMATARAIAQGVSMDLTMSGTTTHLIRIDESAMTVSGTLTPAVDLYLMSEDCDKEGAFRGPLESADINLNKFNCTEGLFADKTY